MSFLKSFSVFHIPPDGAEVTDGEAVSMRNASGADPHVGHAVVSGGAITGVNLNEATACFVDDGDSGNVVNADGTLIYAATANVAAGALTSLQLGPDFGVVETDQEIDVTNGSSTTKGNILVGNGHVVDVTLQTAALVEPNQILSVHNSSDTKTTTGSAHITGGTFDYVTLPATVALVETGDTIGLASSLGAGRGNVTPNINMGFLTNVQLPAQTDVVSDGASKPLTRADNTGLLAMVTTHVPSSDDTFESVALPATAAVITDGGSIEVSNQGDTQGVSCSIAVAANVPTIKLPASTAYVGDGVAIQVPVTGTFVDTITPQVSTAGVITGFTLS